MVETVQVAPLVFQLESPLVLQVHSEPLVGVVLPQEPQVIQPALLQVLQVHSVQAVETVAQVPLVFQQV